MIKNQKQIREVVPRFLPLSDLLCVCRIVMISADVKGEIRGSFENNIL